MAGLSDLGVSKSDIFDVKGILQPYLAPIQEYLNALPDEDRSDDSAGDPQQVPTIQGNQSVEPEQQKRVATVHGEVEARQEADKQIKNVNCEQHNRKFTVHGTSETQINSEQMEDVNSEHHKTEFTFTSGKLIAHTNPKTQRRRVGTIAKVEGQYVWIKPARGRTFKAHVSAVAVVPPERRKRTGK